MPTDVHGHDVPDENTVPDLIEIPAALSASINDYKVVATTTARAQYITDLAAAGITPSTSNPVEVFRSNAPAGLEHEYTTNGTTWYAITAGSRSPFAVSAGVASVTISGGSGLEAVTLPSSRFTQAPIVTATIASGSGTLASASVRAISASTTGFTLVVSDASTATSALVHWQAIQMTSASAAG